MNQELEHIWSQVQGELAGVVDESTYRIWIEPLRPVELVADELVVEVPAQASRWTIERFGRVIQASVELVLGAGTTVQLRSSRGEGESRTGPGGPPARASARRGSRGQEPPTAGAAPHGGGPVANPKLTFEQFVIGDSNRLAHAAALSVAEMPGDAYNPLFIYGPPGVGKTHLLSSIAKFVLVHNPGLTVCGTTGEAFTNEFLAALGGGNTERFKQRFRDVDLLLLDDVQFLERKARTEEEFFHTFNALHDSGRQLVLSSDRPPRDLQALEDRLRERFEAGLVVDVKIPDRNTRVAILRKRAQQDHIALSSPAALEVIAERVASNVRALEGALIRVVAFSSLTSRELTAELAGEVIDSLYPPSSAAGAGRQRTVPEIQAATCELFGITPDELTSPARAARVAWPRQLAMYLSRELTDESLQAIGRSFGGRDHTTVLHACRRASAQIAADEKSRAAVEKLERTLGLDRHPASTEPPDRPS